MSRPPVLALLALLCAGCGGSSGDSPDASGDVMDWLDARDAAPDPDDAAADPSSDADCQERGETVVSLSMVPHVEDGEFTEDGTVLSIDTSDPARASFTVRYPTMTAFPQEQTYTVPVTPGEGVDLEVGDAVRTRFERDLWDGWMQTGLHVERDGSTILFYMDCRHHCAFAFMETAPLDLELLHGVCEPGEDPLGCALLERRGYRVTCPGSADAVDVFDHGSATIACDAGYLVMLEDHTAVTERLMECSGLPDDRIELVVLRLR
jgi:hypothetical protein